MKRQEIKKVKGWIVVLEAGENVIESLLKFCNEQKISSGSFTAIGAVRGAEIGYYSLAEKEYYFKKLEEDREVVSLNGNIAIKDGEVFIHAHVLLGDKKMQILGGHLKEAVVAVTLEVFIDINEANPERILDEDIGLALINF